MTITRTLRSTSFDHAPPLVVPGPLQRVAMVVGDVLLALGIGVGIPLVILAIGIPLALFVQVVLWIVGRL